MQSFGAGVTTRSLFPIFEPTRDSPELRDGSQIFRGACAAGVLRSAAGRPVQKRGKSGVDISVRYGSAEPWRFRPAAENGTRAACAPLKRAGATDQTPRLVARAVFATLPAPRRLTNQKILCARRSLFAIPRDRAQGVRQRHCDRYRVRPDRDRAG